MKGIIEQARKANLGKPKDQLSEKRREELSRNEASFDRHFVIGCITNTEFCGWARENFPEKYLNALSAKKLVSRIYEFYDKYEQKAPGKNIESIIFSGEMGFSQEEIESYEEILESLDEEYEGSEDFNLTYLKERAKRQRLKIALKERAELTIELLKNNELNEATELFQYNTPLDSSLKSKISNTLLTSTEFIEKEIPRPKRYLAPWLMEGSLTMIYGPRGVGKTWLCLIIAVALTRQEKEIYIGPWEKRKTTGVLYVDAEMSEWQLMDNIRGLKNSLADEDPENPLLIFSGNAFAREQESQIDLTKKEWREAIYQTLKQNRNIQVLILDNASALTPGIVENIKEDWDPVNQWMISLRHLGVATILIHHAGKGGKQRGTSGREDAMDFIIKADFPSGYNADEDFAWFQVNFEKSRMLKPGDNKKSFTLRIIKNDEDSLTWREEVASIGNGGNRDKKIIADIIQGKKNKTIAEMHNVTAGRVSQIKTQAIQAGYLDKKGKPTETGIKLMEEYKNDSEEAIGN
jgi:KaiC/GvpD/RAD55 family RecA-like ATPase